MKTGRYHLLALTLGCGILSQTVLAAAAPRIKPTVSYTQSLVCPNGHQTNYFDVTYFNSEIPLGSMVSMNVGFEHDTGVERVGWSEPNIIVMKQWEQFGWVLRIGRDVACGINQTTLAGIDFFVQIKAPSGEIVREPSLTQQGNQGYYRAQIPDLHDCTLVDGESQQTCSTEVQWVNPP